MAENWLSNAQVVAPNSSPPTIAPTTASTPSTNEGWLTNAQSTAENNNLAVKPQPFLSPNTGPMTYAAAPAVGALKGVAGMADTAATGQNLLEKMQAIPFQTGPAKTPEELLQENKLDYLGNTANKYLPEPKGQLESALQGMGQGAAENLIYGPEAILPGALSSGVTAWRNSASPDTPKANIILGLAAGLVNPLSVLRSDSPITAARKLLDITGVTAAGIGEDSWKRTIRALREVPGSVVEQREALGRSQVEQAIEKQADILGTSTTLGQAGKTFQPAVDAWPKAAKQDLKATDTLIDNIVDPETTMVDTGQLLNKLDKEFTPPPGAAQMDPGAQSLLNRIKSGIYDYSMQAKYGSDWQNLKLKGEQGFPSPIKPGDTAPSQIPLAAIKYLKRSVADDLQTGILSNQDASVAHTTAAWSALSDAEKTAYTGPVGDLFNQMQDGWAKYFINLKENVAPYLSANGGPTPEGSVAKLLSETRKGGEKIENTLNLLPPNARNEIASFKLRQMGEGADGNFNPQTFFKNWNNPKLFTPEAKQALFGQGPDKDIPKMYSNLATVAEEQARSEKASNVSGTAGTNLALKLFMKFGAPVTAAAGAGLGAAYDYDNSGVGVGTGIGTLGLELAAGKAASHLFTNPSFVRLLASNPKIEQLPLKLRALAAANPDINHEITAFQNYVVQQKDNNEKGFMGGGYADPAPNNPNGYSGGGPTAQWVQDVGYSDGGPSALFSNLNAADKDMHLTDQEKNLYKYHLNNLHGDGKIIHPNGDISTILQVSPEVEGKVYNLPTVTNGKVLPDEDAAVENASKIGINHFPSYPDRDTAESRYQQMHQYMDRDVQDYLKNHKASGGLVGDIEGEEANSVAPPHSFSEQEILNTPRPDANDPFSGKATKDKNENAKAPGTRDKEATGEKAPWEDGHNQIAAPKPMNIAMGGEVAAPWPTAGNNPASFAKGGYEDSRPSYNPQLPRVAGGGWSEGGLAPSEIQYATGGSVENQIEHVESGDNPIAKNPRSSASGVGQFLDSTWVSMMHKYHPEISDPLKYKNDPVLGHEMVNHYAEENMVYLKKNGVDITPGNVYLAHFLGPAGAVKMNNLDPNMPMKQALVGIFGDNASKVLAANPFLANKTVGDLHAWAEAKMNGSSIPSDKSNEPDFLPVELAQNKPPQEEPTEEDNNADKAPKEDAVLSTLVNHPEASPEVKGIIKSIASDSNVKATENTGNG